MSRRLVILTEIISPYRIPLFNALATNPDLAAHVIFLSETDPNLRQWRVYKEEVRFSNQVLPSWRRRLGKFNALVNRKVANALTQAAPDVILCGGYSYLASWQALAWARSRDVPFLLWSESNLQDSRRSHPPVELLKNEFLRRCRAFVVPGQSARDYLLAHKISEDRIFTAPNAVDDDLFRVGAIEARAQAAANRRNFELPARYVLFVGRLVQEKGVFELLRAYAELEESLRREVGLVFVGDGPAREELQKRAAEVPTGEIRFPGFVHREQLAIYYALAEMFVLPTYTDTWGLVVNEAMACGLPVVVSHAAGCSRDLVKEGWNGHIVPSQDVASLKSAIKGLAAQPETCATMGAHSADHILQFSPANWSLAIARAVKRTVDAHD